MAFQCFFFVQVCVAITLLRDNLLHYNLCRKVWAMCLHLSSFKDWLLLSRSLCVHSVVDGIRQVLWSLRVDLPKVWYQKCPWCVVGKKNLNINRRNKQKNPRQPNGVGRGMETSFTWNQVSMLWYSGSCLSWSRAVKLSGLSESHCRRHCCPVFVLDSTRSSPPTFHKVSPTNEIKCTVKCHACLDHCHTSHTHALIMWLLAHGWLRGFNADKRPCLVFGQFWCQFVLFQFLLFICFIAWKAHSLHVDSPMVTKNSQKVFYSFLRDHFGRSYDCFVHKIWKSRTSVLSSEVHNVKRKYLSWLKHAVSMCRHNKIFFPYLSSVTAVMFILIKHRCTLSFTKSNAGRHEWKLPSYRMTQCTKLEWRVPSGSTFHRQQ